ncbi:MAG: lycopene cyclase [Croceitalea sp.]|nr:lycopene cyclase [Croceitalea sp.]
MPKYDYIILGAGASGLLLADAMDKDPYFSNKKVLLLDKSSKNTNDRTWCFWEKGAGPFDEILHKTWARIYFAGKNMQQSFTIEPYSYKMLRGIDFYDHYLKRTLQNPNFEFRKEAVIKVEEIEGHGQVTTTAQTYKAQTVFNSIFDYKELMGQEKYPVLQQHFVGWFIKTKKPIFDDEEARFMDFSIPQKGNTRFMYVLPFSKTEALVEYTLFSESPLDKEEYELAIETYLKTHLGITEYEILEKEEGNIPMTCFDFNHKNTNHVFHIGIAGGWAKASTGYTFMSTVKKVALLVKHLKKGKPLLDFETKDRFWFYDLLVLDILDKHNHLGSSIFESLFKKRKPQEIFKFLDEETTLLEDIWIMAAPKPWPFIRALFGRKF